MCSERKETCVTEIEENVEDRKTEERRIYVDRESRTM